VLGIFKYFKRKDWALVVISLLHHIRSMVWFEVAWVLANITTLVQL